MFESFDRVFVPCSLMVEQMTVNHEDIGSSPIRGARKILFDPYVFLYPESGAAVARLFWEQKVRGSNPLFPILSS